MSPPTRILIIDDDADFREFVRIVLESHGYTVAEAENGVTGLTVARRELPAVVLLDAMMSYELAGVGIIRALHDDPQLSHTPVILISAVLSEDEDRFLPPDEKAMVYRFLSKPVSPHQLLAEVAAALATAALPPPA